MRVCETHFHYNATPHTVGLSADFFPNMFRLLRCSAERELERERLVGVFLFFFLPFRCSVEATCGKLATSIVWPTRAAAVSFLLLYPWHRALRPFEHTLVWLPWFSYVITSM